MRDTVTVSLGVCRRLSSGSQKQTTLEEKSRKTVGNFIFFRPCPLTDTPPLNACVKTLLAYSIPNSFFRLLAQAPIKRSAMMAINAIQTPATRPRPVSARARAM
ncbi:MAG: hypothetical protein ACI845_003951 [Gammaproteobacteria bacterium]|jgi:hypothetical protein